jgi:putative transcriptional regulator
MKAKTIEFGGDDLVRSVEEVRDRIAAGRKHTLKVTRIKSPRPAPEVSAHDVERLRSRLRVSQATFAAMLNVPTVTAISWEKGRRKPSGAALRLLQIASKHPKILAG